MAEATLTRVKGLLTDERGARPVVLIGAGGSVKSGIPLASDLTDQIARWGYCRAHNRDLRDQSVERSDWVQWLRTLDWYQDSLALEVRYPIFVGKLLQPREERKRFFQEAVRTHTMPSQGYVHLAELVGKGWVRTILTTNFDDLIVQACRANVDAAQIMEIKNPDLAHLVSSDPTDPQLLHLHGAVEHYTDCNLEEETKHLATKYLAALAPPLKDHPLIVIGYRGAEPSVMQDLLLGGADAAAGYRHGIFWCLRGSSSEAHPYVHELAEKIGDNFFIVPISDFDQAMAELNRDVARSARAPAVATTPATPDLAVSTATDSDVDWQLVRARVPIAAKGLAMDVPADPSRAWLESTLIGLRLAIRDEEQLLLTRAGELLFSIRRPSRVQFSWSQRRQELTGNLCQLVEELTAILTEVNAPFRLKGPVSEDVRPYPQLALKELLVNALVHRDHTNDEPVCITVTDDDVTFASPGTVISTVDPAQLGRLAVKGYRNPLLANFFYGTGDMDKRGSGLVDVRRWTEEIGGSATFVSPGGDSSFMALLRARPERPKTSGDVAEPSEGYEVFFANALSVKVSSGAISTGRCEAANRTEVLDRHRGARTAPFAVQGGELLTLSDLTQATNPLVQEIHSSPKQIELTEFCTDPDDERVVVGLLNEALRRHARSIGLEVLERDQRMYFPRTAAGERKVSYRGRVRDARRTVVKERISSTTGKTIYWEHHSLHWQFRRFGEDWYLLLVPGWVFTRDGENQLLGGRRTTSLSTRRAAKDYNQQVQSHLFFWSAVLAGTEASRILDDGSDAVELERDLLTAHLVGAPSALGTDRDESEGELELEEVDADLIDLAEAEAEEEDEETEKTEASLAGET